MITAEGKLNSLKKEKINFKGNFFVRNYAIQESFPFYKEGKIKHSSAILTDKRDFRSLKKLNYEGKIVLLSAVNTIKAKSKHFTF